MLIKVAHRTEYSFEGPVQYALQRVRLQPGNSPLQTVLSWDMRIEGGGLEVEYDDHHGNHVGLICSDENVQVLSVVVEGEVQTHDLSGVLGQVYGRAPLWYFKRPTPQTEAGPLITELARTLDTRGSALDRLHALSRAILERVPYALNVTHAETRAEEAVAQKSGVCQDHANIFIAAARTLGYPVRYVSGYLFMDDRIDQEASHAWAEAHVDDLGWVGFDVSNGISPDERYVRLAIGRDAHDAAPVSGLRMGSGGEGLVVSLQVQQ
ncbi:transglutaminase family protein [Roseobacter sp. S98]|uniref:transglutaminase family protein n=1 Tax=Roseobacter algicola (ex Choi et al. 2025) (nom. illeg.) TaxID=3092138 RepID=UPI0035C74895